MADEIVSEKGGGAGEMINNQCVFLRIPGNT
jgi:hypothetical protein